MIQIITGETGKGKTRDLIERANQAINSSKGSIVYLDKSNKNMFELNNKIRMINTDEYGLGNSSEFYGFICGVIAQDHDIEQVYVDNFVKMAKLNENNSEDIHNILYRLHNISEQYHVTMVVTLSLDKQVLPDDLQELVLVAL